jgi:hypothetical protein
MKSTSRKKQPTLRDVIVHTEASYNRVSEGKVIQLLSMQFLYEERDGAIRHCLFEEDWNFKHG